MTSRMIQGRQIDLDSLQITDTNTFSMMGSSDKPTVEIRSCGCWFMTLGRQPIVAMCVGHEEAVLAAVRGEIALTDLSLWPVEEAPISREIEENPASEDVVFSKLGPGLRWHKE